MTISQSLKTVLMEQQPKEPKPFTGCPACGSNQLIFVGTETLCGSCDWETTFRSVQAGHMDQIFKACKEQFKKEVTCLL